jgi:hypothetical protein
VNKVIAWSVAQIVRSESMFGYLDLRTN